jgi:uncharacterized protein YeaO (DUF488 family)
LGSPQVKHGTLTTRRWNDPPVPAEGTRILICRYRPRGVPKSDETWDVWMPNLGPSRELLAAFHGKEGSPIAWASYRVKYLSEMRSQRDAIQDLAERVAKGENISLLCSSACVRESRCHRSLLRSLIEQAIAAL